MAAPARPITIDKYELGVLLGEGTSGATYRVRMPDSSLERYGCLKLLRDRLGEDPAALKRFQKEAEIATMLVHRNVAALYDFNKKHKPPYIVYQLVRGVNLALLHEKQRLAVDDVLYIGAEIAMGLYAAHSFKEGKVRGVVHRDLKPENVMVSVDGDVVLADFGLAKVQGRRTDSQAAAVAFTPLYVPPEVLRGASAGSEGDMFALGVILYELAARRHPFEKEVAAATSYAIVKGAREDIAVLAPAYPARFHELVNALLDVNPEKRPTAREALEAFHVCKVSLRARPRVGQLVQAARGRGTTKPPPSVVVEGSEDTTMIASGLASKVSGGRFVALGALVVGLMMIGAGAVGAMVFGGAWQGDGHAGQSVPTQPARESTAVSAADQASSEEVRSTGGKVDGDATRGEAAPASTAADAEGAERGEIAEPDAPRPEVARQRVSAEAPKKPGRKRVKRHKPPSGAGAKATARPGSLRVKVRPWGDVFVDGVKRGRAPVTVKLSPGVHKVRVVAYGDSVTKVVRVAPGSAQTVSLAIGDAP